MRGRQTPVHNSLNSLFICFAGEWGPKGSGPRYANTTLSPSAPAGRQIRDGTHNSTRTGEKFVIWRLTMEIGEMPFVQLKVASPFVEAYSASK